MTDMIVEAESVSTQTQPTDIDGMKRQELMAACAKRFAGHLPAGNVWITHRVTNDEMRHALTTGELPERIFAGNVAMMMPTPADDTDKAAALIAALQGIISDTPAQTIDEAAVNAEGNLTKAHFASLQDYYACADAEHAPENCASREIHPANTRRAKWFGTADYISAAALAQTGWAEGAAKIKEAQRTLEPYIKPLRAQATRNRLRSYRAVAGESPDIGRYLQGNPECMIDYRRQTQRRLSRVITLAIMTTHPAEISAAQITNRGAAIAAAVELLESSGVSVRLIAGTACQSIIGIRKGQVLITVELKRAGEKIDIAQLAYVLAHPSFARRTTFAVREKFDDEIRQIMGFVRSGGYGASLPLPAIENASMVFGSPIYNKSDYKTPADSASKLQALIHNLT